MHDAPRRAVYDDRRWLALRRRVIRRWVVAHGWWCPGDDRHREHDVLPGQLTLDHRIPIEQGGAPFEERNTQVLCRAGNSAKRDRV